MPIAIAVPVGRGLLPRGEHGAVDEVVQEQPGDERRQRRVLHMLFPGLVVGVSTGYDLDDEQHGKADEEPQRGCLRARLLECLGEQVGQRDGEEDSRRHAHGRAPEARADAQAGQPGERDAAEPGARDQGWEEGRHGRRAYNAGGTASPGPGCALGFKTRRAETDTSQAGVSPRPPVMRTTRALFAGIGTTGSLVAAAAGVFLVVSAVLAFKGWPGTGFTDRIDNLFVKDAPSGGVGDKRGTQVAAVSAGTAAAAVAGTAAGPTFGAPGVILGNDGGAQRGGTVRLPGGTLVSTGPGGPGTVGSGQGGGGALPSLPGSDTSPVQNGAADTVQQTGSALGNTVRQTTGSVGSTVGGPAGGAVSQTGDSVGSTVDNTTKAAGDLLRQP